MSTERKPKTPWFRPVLLGSLASMGIGTVFIVAVYQLIFMPALRQGEVGYGYWLFFLVPVVMGVTGSLVINFRAVRPASFGYLASLMSFTMTTLALMAGRLEGLICLGMAMPLLFPMYWAGYFAVRRILQNYHPENPAAMVSLVPIPGVATVLSARYSPPPEIRTETTTLDIDAPPSAIWPYLFEMDGIPRPKTLPFRYGVAHPVRISSTGRGVGASRQCVLTTGVMPEAISASERDRRLEFRVLATPAAMTEFNPFGPVDAPHLHGYFLVHRGEFRLIPLPGGRTRLVGTSDYSLRIQPAAYWNLWSDSVVEQVHLAVMGEIKRRVERR